MGSQKFIQNINVTIVWYENWESNDAVGRVSVDFYINEDIIG